MGMQESIRHSSVSIYPHHDSEYAWGLSSNLILVLGIRKKGTITHASSYCMLYNNYISIAIL